MGKRQAKYENCDHLIGSLPNMPNIGTWHIFRVLNIKLAFWGQKLNSGQQNEQNEQNAQNVIIW